jgi:hypothetical protein
MPWKKGKFYSNKNDKKFSYRSSWELVFFKYLETQTNILSYDVETLRIAFHYRRRNRNYIPDVLIHYSDGSKELIEIKPERFKGYAINRAKFAAAEVYCRQNNIKFKVITETTLKKMGLL